MRFHAGLLAVLAAMTACGESPPAKPPGFIDPGYPNTPSPAILEVYALDIWGRFIEVAETFEVTREGAVVERLGYPVSRFALSEAGTYRVNFTARDHEPLEVLLNFDGTSELPGLSLATASSGHGVSLSHDRRVTRDGDAPATVHTVYLGLRHRWFAPSGPPPRRGNRVELLINGEEAWSRFHQDVVAAVDTIHLATWWWEPGFELIRGATPTTVADEATRRPNTILEVFDRSPATKRVIATQFYSQDNLINWLLSQSELRDRGAATDDDFEFMGQANETEGTFWFEGESVSFVDRVKTARPEVDHRAFDAEQAIPSKLVPRWIDLTDFPVVDVSWPHASYHQKLATIDDEIAYVGGMNLRYVDWDSSEHRVFDARRMEFDSGTSAREDVAAKARDTDTPPVADYQVRIEGPAVQDVSDVFRDRWELLRQEGADYSQNASSFAVERDLPRFDDGVEVQIASTMPQPFWRHAIAESWLAAIENAEHYVFLETLYFRSTMLNDALFARMAEVPDLEVVVITGGADEWTDVGCEWASISFERFQNAYPERFHAFSLQAFDTSVGWGIDETDGNFAPIYIHAKLFVVDDHYLSIGSANKNNRSQIYEGELSAIILDEAWVTSARRRILSGLLGHTPSDDPASWIEELEAAAQKNDRAYASWSDAGFDLDLDGAPLPLGYLPAGFVYSLIVPPPNECLIQGAGEDMT